MAGKGWLRFWPYICIGSQIKRKKIKNLLKFCQMTFHELLRLMLKDKLVLWGQIFYLVSYEKNTEESEHLTLIPKPHLSTSLNTSYCLETTKMLIWAPYSWTVVTVSDHNPQNHSNFLLVGIITLCINFMDFYLLIY